MINLAGNPEADKHIQEELALANILMIRGAKIEGEVPCTIYGSSYDWTFKRAWRYWIASAPDGKGLPLEVAAALHEKEYPVIGAGQPKIYGEVIRVRGDCTCPHPKDRLKYYDSMGRLIIFDPEGKQKKAARELLKDEEFKKLWFEDTRTGIAAIYAKALIESYHIDTQLGLNEFAKLVERYHPGGLHGPQ